MQPALDSSLLYKAFRGQNVPHQAWKCYIEREASLELGDKISYNLDMTMKLPGVFHVHRKMLSTSNPPSNDLSISNKRLVALDFLALT